MRVLQVIHAFPPESWAGAENFVRLLARELAKKTEQAVFHRFADRSQPEYATTEEEFEGLKVYRVNNTFHEVRVFSDAYRNARIEEHFARVLGDYRPDVVHFHHLTGLSTGLPGICRRAGIPAVMTLHDYWLLCQRGQLLDSRLADCGGPTWLGCSRCLKDQLVGGAGRGTFGRLYGLYQLGLRRRGIRKAIEGLDLFISPSRYLKKYFAEHGFPDEKIIQLDNGFDQGLFTDERSPSDKLRFGFIGSLMASKGALVAAQAFRRVSGDDLELKIYGAYQPYHGLEGYHDLLKAEAERDHRIALAGSFAPDKIGEILAGIDVLIFPSIWRENSPLTIHEAYLAGVPVLASDIGALPELVGEGRGGALFRAGDEADLAAKIAMLQADRSLLEVWRLTLPPVMTIQECAAEHLRIYETISRNPDASGHRRAVH